MLTALGTIVAPFVFFLKADVYLPLRAVVVASNSSLEVPHRLPLRPTWGLEMARRQGAPHLVQSWTKKASKGQLPHFRATAVLLPVPSKLLPRGQSPIP